MRSRGFLPLLAAAATLCVAQVPATGAATKTYHSDALNFDLMYPESFTDAKTAADGSPNTEAILGANCVTAPVEFTDMTTGFHMISLKQYVGACLKGKASPSIALGTTATSFLTDSLSRLGKPVMNSTANYFLAGHNASTVSGMVKLSPSGANATIFGAVSCVSSDKGIVCFQFLANDCPSLASLSASTVKFVGAVAAPIIPAGIGAACKK